MGGISYHRDIFLWFSYTWCKQAKIGCPHNEGDLLIRGCHITGDATVWGIKPWLATQNSWYQWPRAASCPFHKKKLTANLLISLWCHTAVTPAKLQHATYCTCWFVIAWSTRRPTDRWSDTPFTWFLGNRLLVFFLYFCLTLWGKQKTWDFITHPHQPGSQHTVADMCWDPASLSGGNKKLETSLLILASQGLSTLCYRVLRPWLARMSLLSPFACLECWEFRILETTAKQFKPDLDFCTYHSPFC